MLNNLPLPLVAAMCLISGLLGFYLKASNNKKSQKRILELENDMLRSHKRILSLEQELSDQDNKKSGRIIDLPKGIQPHSLSK
jgi:hypothetical protein